MELSYRAMRSPRVAMFGVLRREGIVMLPYNSTHIYSITNSPCNPPLPYAQSSIPLATPYPCIWAYRYALLYNMNTYYPCTCTARCDKHTRYNTNCNCIVRHIILIPKGTPDIDTTRTRCNAVRHVYTHTHTQRRHLDLRPVRYSPPSA